MPRQLSLSGSHQGLVELSDHFSVMVAVLTLHRSCIETRQLKITKKAKLKETVYGLEHQAVIGET